ncbi:hypothetical protein PAMP_010251 [Pampus punctatissimus]
MRDIQRMEKEGRKPKVYVSTFRLDLKPQTRPFCVGKQKNNGLDTTDRGVMRNNKLGVPSATDVRQTPIKAVRAPRFKERPRDHTVCKGSDATLQGVITGEKVHSSKSCLKNDASLSLTQRSSGDAGTYTFTTDNTARIQSSDSDSHITGIRDFDPQTKISSVNEPSVEFLDPPEQVEVRVGKQARLCCEFRCRTVPVACCWIYNRDKVVVGGPRMSVRSSNTQSSVEISQACPDDKGSYTVIVRNQKGSAQHTVSLNVIDRPDPPASHPVVSQISTQSLELSWAGPSYDGGTAVLGYIVEVRQDGPDRPGSWTEVISRCKNTSYHVCSGLEPQGQYRFRVRAYNTAGVSEPSQESECVKMMTTKKEEQEQSSSTMIIDTKHKVKDHYNVHEKLGVCRLSCSEALTHPWMVSINPRNRRSTMSLKKDKMRHFLAKRKWKKTGKAVLALQRMANLSNRPDSPGNSSEEPGWSQEAEEAIRSLDKQLQSEPCFQQPLKDTTLPKGATAHLTCLVNGYPQPDIKWLQNEKLVSESSRVTMKHHDDGLCSLVLAVLKPSDAGVYVCKASNKLGEAMCSAKLKVEM